MDTKRIDQIYEEIAGLTIELEPDPTVLGPKYINNVIALCRNYLNRTTLILLELQRERRLIQKQHGAEEAVLKIQANHLLSEDERVKRLPNIRDREATVAVILSEQNRKVDDLLRELLDMETIEKAVRLRHNELKHTSADIKMQRQSIRDEVDTGSFYGDEANGGSKGPPRDDINEGELDRLLNEPLTPSAETAPKEPEVEVEVEPDAPEETGTFSEEPEAPAVAVQIKADAPTPEAPTEETVAQEAAPSTEDVDPLADVMAALEVSDPAPAAEVADEAKESTQEDPDIAAFLGEPVPGAGDVKTKKKVAAKKKDAKPEAKAAEAAVVVPTDTPNDDLFGGGAEEPFDFAELLTNI